MAHSIQPAGLLAACKTPDSLFNTPQTDLLRLIYNEYPREIHRLQRAYSIRPASSAPDSSQTLSPSPSQILFSKEYDEVNRTLVSFLALCWVHLDQYANFIGAQPESITTTDSILPKESFTWLRYLYTTTITTPESLYTLITLIITNDLGKDPQLAIDYHAKTGIDISHLNHDEILLRAYKADLIPALSTLTPESKSDAIKGIELGATFNFGQLAQAENAPVSLSSVLSLRENKQAFQFRFLEQIFDVAGADGHVDWTCARKLGQNRAVFDSLRGVYVACSGVLEGSLDLRQGYDLILVRRAEELRAKGFVAFAEDGEGMEMTENNRAFMRLLCMGNVTSKEIAVLYRDTWNKLDEEIRTGLVRSLSVFGRREEPAVQPTYMPALLSGTTNGRALACAFRLLYRVMTALNDVEDPSVVVIERSVLEVLKRYVETGELNENPTVLDRVDVPKGVVAQTDSSARG
ncbi:hypothetical protein BJX70DRAFT_370187 [Aspergillus crustosus]